MELTKENSADQITAAIESLRTEPDAVKTGRGIVIAAGGTRLSINAWVNIRMLREHGCQLPIEVWYLGEKEYNAGWHNLVRPYNVRMVNAHHYLDRFPHQRLNGWELKPYAIAHSSFEEVMFLDADNVPVVDPTYLFDAEQYKQTGTVFWPDYGRLSEDREAWGVFGVPFRDEPEVESGQSIINKSTPGVWECLDLANWLMQNSNNFFFKFVHGDKEIFHMSWRRLEQNYAMPAHGIMPLDGVMCQHDFDGKRVFQHRNMRKWSFDDNPMTPGFEHEARCLELVEDLRVKWSPVSDDPPSEEDLEKIKSLDGKRFAYVRVGYDVREVELSAHGTFVEGGDGRERFWTVRDGELLIAGDDGRRTMRLQDMPAVSLPFVLGCFIGSWEVHEKMPVMFIPIN